MSRTIASFALSSLCLSVPVDVSASGYAIGTPYIEKNGAVKVSYLPSYAPGNYTLSAYPPPTAYEFVNPQAAPMGFPPPAPYGGTFNGYAGNRYANWGLYAPFIQEASQRFGIPTTWIEAVIKFESRGNSFAVSNVGAMGLMQLMPGTWRILQARHGLGYNPFDPRDNILAGTAYLRELHDRYGAPGFLVAYNAGPARWESYLKTGQLLPESAGQMIDALRPYL